MGAGHTGIQLQDARRALAWAAEIVASHGLDCSPEELLHPLVPGGPDAWVVMGMDIPEITADRYPVLRPHMPITVFREVVASGPCLYCGDIATTADHRLPVARCGNSTRINLVPACTFCNMSKRDRLWPPGHRMAARAAAQAAASMVGWFDSDHLTTSS